MDDKQGPGYDRLTSKINEFKSVTPDELRTMLPTPNRNAQYIVEWLYDHRGGFLIADLHVRNHLKKLPYVMDTEDEPNLRRVRFWFDPRYNQTDCERHLEQTVQVLTAD